MKSFRLSLLFILPLLAHCAPAQTAPAPAPSAFTPQITLGQSIVALNGPWAFHPGDDPAYALPGYDDSAWTRVDLSVHAGSHDPYYSSDAYVPGWTARGFPNLTGYAWYRTRFQLTGNDTDLWLEMPPNFDDGYQVYVNGKLVGAFGAFTAHDVRNYFSRSTRFHLPHIAAGQQVVLALRFYMDPDSPGWNVKAGGLHSAPVIGLSSTIALLQSRNSNVNLHTYLSYLLLAIALALAGIVALWIYLIDRSEQAYLWLTAAFAMGAATALAEFLGSVTYWLSNNVELLVRDVAGVVFVPFFWLLFWVHWFRLRRLRMAVRAGGTLVVLELCAFALLRQFLLGWLIPLSWAHSVWVATVVLRTAFALLLLAATVGGMRQDRAEGWIALPAIVPLAVGIFNLDLQMVGLPMEYFPFGIHLGLDVIAWLVLAVIVLALVLRRFLQNQVRQQELAQEMQQAQAIQALLVPHELPQAPGYRIDGTYIPASHVGGDFYLVLPLPRDGTQLGGALVVLGDVSGKGLRAAMVVSMTVGAVRAIAGQTVQPAEVLQRLNSELAGQLKNGFITCLCLRLDADGVVTIANAGHLPPWLNGREIAMAGAMPLGVVASVEYEAQSFPLNDRDVLIVMSDGIVEARRASDGELYGFERLAALLPRRPPAAEIARTAQRFGQEDDISVLSITRTGNTVAAIA